MRANGLRKKGLLVKAQKLVEMPHMGLRLRESPPVCFAGDAGLPGRHFDVLVQEIEPGGSAYEGGLRTNDVILYIDDKPCRSAYSVVSRSMQAPSSMRMKVRRDIGLTVGEGQSWLQSRKAHWAWCRGPEGRKVAAQRRAAAGMGLPDGIEAWAQNQGVWGTHSIQHGQRGHEDGTSAWSVAAVPLHEEEQPDTLMDVAELRALLKVVRHLRSNWPKNTVDMGELDALEVLIKERLSALGVGELEGSRSSSSSSTAGSSATCAQVDDAPVLHWAQCELCEKWRVLSKAISSSTSFRCADLSRSCKEPEDTPASVASASLAKADDGPNLSGMPVYITSVNNETPAKIGAKLGVSVSDLVRRNKLTGKAGGEGHLRGLFRSSKLFVGTTLVLPASATSVASATGYGLGCSYATAVEDETPVTIAQKLGISKVQDLVRLNKPIHHGINSKSKLLRGTVLLLPAKAKSCAARVVRRTKGHRAVRLGD